LLDKENVESFVKTSGKSGLHVLSPWKQTGGYDEARKWAAEIAQQVVDALPELATTERSKAARRGKVYVDVIQNARGHHVVPPYVIRAVPEATVSTPLEWKELTGKLDPKKFTTDVVLERVRKKDPIAGLVKA
jgi:bifunctional non-homologous end joining protein LigD